MRIYMRRFVMLSALLTLVFSTGTDAAAQQAKWYKGNTHTHTNNSDGDSSPDEVVKWYRSNTYNFVVITDHEYITPVGPLNSMFGKENVFAVFSGQEVTDRVKDLPYHINGLGLSKVVLPAKAGDPVESVQKNIDAVSTAGGLPQLNHPNFGWALSAGEIRMLKGIYLMEIANAHPLVNNHGGVGRPSVEAIWDELLTAGMVIYGVADDDSHTFKRPGDRSAALPGQAWIYVRATELTAPAIFAAMLKGDFYSSTGVELDDVSTTETTFTVDIKEAKGRRYRTEFIGSGGRVLAETGFDPAVYQIRGGEGYVRARVRDSNGLIAWTQPIFMSKKQ